MLIFNDITSNCNLRCPFCCNDFSKLPANENMTAETFLEVIKKIPDCNTFFFSCGFEPTINPEWLNLLEMIPAEYKPKIFMTTNLSLFQPDETLTRLAQANLSVLNISLDSLTPEIYESLRKGAKFETFINNLERLVLIFEKYPDAPKISFTTMILQQNIDELLTLAFACKNKYKADRHSFRTPFKFSLEHIDKEWAEKSLISQEQWEEATYNISRLGYNFEFQSPPDAPDTHCESIIINSKGEVKQ